MSTFTQILYQIVFSTKGRIRALTFDNQDRLYKYMTAVLTNKNCHVYQINGVEDHIHIVTHLHPLISLSKLVKDIKLASSSFIKEEALFPKFAGWQDGYGAFTYSFREKDKIIDYVKNQKNHHRSFSYYDEYKALLDEHGVAYDDKYILG